MPMQVYMLDPDTREVKVVVDHSDKNNGVAFTADGKTAYVYVGLNCVNSKSPLGCSYLRIILQDGYRLSGRVLGQQSDRSSHHVRLFLLSSYSIAMRHSYHYVDHLRLLTQQLQIRRRSQIRLLL